MLLQRLLLASILHAVIFLTLKCTLPVCLVFSCWAQHSLSNGGRRGATGWELHANKITQTTTNVVFWCWEGTCKDVAGEINTTSQVQMYSITYSHYKFPNRKVKKAKRRSSHCDIRQFTVCLSISAAFIFHVLALGSHAMTPFSCRPCAFFIDPCYCCGSLPPLLFAPSHSLPIPAASNCTGAPPGLFVLHAAV